MRILLVAPSSDFTAQVHKALCDEGHEVAFINDRLDYGVPGIFRGLRSLWKWSRRIPWWRRHANATLQHLIIHTVHMTKPRLLLAIKGMNIKPPTLQILREQSITTACWFMDNAANEPYATWVHTIGPKWDFLLSFDPGILNQFPRGAHTKVAGIPVGINPDVYRSVPISDEDRRRFTCQVCFVGAPYPDRVALLSRIVDLDLKIFGWPGWKNTTLAKYYYGSLNARESAMAYRLAGICVNTNVLPHANGVNLKTFEICAAGGFQLTDECADLKTLFAVGSELDIFHDSEEFRQKIDYWLGHDDERRRVASAGKVRAIRDHSIRERVRRILAIVAGK